MGPHIFTIIGVASLIASTALSIITLIAHRKVRDADATSKIAAGAADAVEALNAAVEVNKDLADRFKKDFDSIDLKCSTLENELASVRKVAHDNLQLANLYKETADKNQAAADKNALAMVTLTAENKELKEKVECLTEKIEQLLSDPNRSSI